VKQPRIMPPLTGMMHWHSLFTRHASNIRSALTKGLKALDEAVGIQPKGRLQPAFLRQTTRQPLHPIARIRQSESRWYSTARKFVEGSGFTSSVKTGRSGVKYDRASFPQSTVRTYIQNSSGRAPFAHTLRPNLTGGTLGRTAGGYTQGSGRIGGARYFSHGPSSQAHVVQNVSQAMRAFFISGHKAQFDGLSPNGEKKFKPVSTLQEATGRKMRSLPKATPGSWIDFQINPTITALSSLNGVVGYEKSTTEVPHINSEGLIDALSVDFSRALKDLAAVHNDIKRLSVLGDLLITCEQTSLRVHFPGCDAETVERLCQELHVNRGTVSEDPAFSDFVGADIALLFPMAPGTADSLSNGSVSGGEFYENNVQRHVIDYDDMMSSAHSDKYSTASEHSFEDILDAERPWLPSTPHDQRSLETVSVIGSDEYSPLEYQGFEGIYRFIEELDRVG